MNNETAEAISSLIDALRDGRYTADELDRIEKDLADVRHEVEDAIMAVCGRRSL